MLPLVTEKFELLNVISTAGHLHGWHTLTYLAFTPHNGHDDDKVIITHLNRCNESYIQWDLRTEDTLGPCVLSFV